MSAFRLQLDLQLFSGEKTESATPKKRADARKKGQVAKSMDLPGALILCFSFVTLLMFGGFFKERLFRLFTSTFDTYLLSDVSLDSVTSMFGTLLSECLLLLAPLFCVTMVIALVANYLQFGLLFTGEPLMMKFNKLNPIEGAKRLFAMRAIVDLFKALLKLSIVAIFVYMTLWGKKEQLLALSDMPPGQTLAFVASITVQLGIQIGIILIVLAAFDYLYQRYEYEKNLRMSKQDIKDEYKKTEGDPLVKGKIKERQRKMAMRRMMQDVPKADVVITNPTHYAVALQYESGNMAAPKVVAKGTDYIAFKIRDIAKEHGVVTMENRPLARALYDQVEVGETIPADLFQAVAEVLAYVFKMKGKTN